MSTFYVSSLNPAAQSLGVSGLFSGVATADDAVGVSAIDVSIPLATVSPYFKFTSDGVLGTDTTDTTIDVVGLAYSGTAAWTFPAAGTALIAGSSGLTANGLVAEFLPLLSAKVFGSSSAVDLFSNGDKIVTSWHAAAQAAKGSLNTKTADSTISVAATKELINSMFAGGLAKRFSMAYSSGSDAAVDTSGVTGGNSNVAVVKVTGNGAGANVDVTTQGITVKTIAAAGTQYVAGDSITIATTPSNLAFVLNTVQAAMLNGKLSDI